MTDEASVEERVTALEATVAELSEQVDVATNRDIPLLKGTVRAIIDADIDEIGELPEAGRAFQDRWAEREARLQAVEAQLETLGDVGAAKSTKTEKYSAILSFAANKRNGNAKVAVSPAEIKGCTGVSRRYAYDLLEAMAADIEGVRIREAKQVTTGSGVEQKGKALLVDCEQVHTSDGSVNQFTTGRGDREGE